MSGNTKTEGHWESHSKSTKATKIGNNPALITGKEAEAEGTFDVSHCFVIYILKSYFILSICLGW
jgi:hypothetical protein